MNKRGQLQFENELIRVWHVNSTSLEPSFEDNLIVVGLQEGKVIQKKSLPPHSKVVVIEMKSPKSRVFPSIPID